MSKGYVAFILHAHLPFIRHPEYDDFLEERWLFEAISETYIPLINNFSRLQEEGIDFKIAMSISPPLLCMLDDPLLQERYVNYLNRLIELTGKEIERTQHHAELNRLAAMYHIKYKNDLYIYKEKYNCSLIKAFKELEDSGILELITCAATHGFLPLLGIHPETVRAQISVGVETFARYFGHKPRGIWLPECGYIPEAEEYLAECDVEYIIIESHGILFANPRPVYGTFAPIVSKHGTIAFGRDIESSKQVWSSEVGYPGDHDYRDFYRDIGYDLDISYIKPYISSDGYRVHTGIKYYSITGKTQDKLIYNPERAYAKAESQAEDFIESRINQVDYLSSKMDKPPVIVCPYDAELFGHWWYEGPYWLYNVVKKMNLMSQKLSLITPGAYIDKYPVMQAASPCISSWGSKGYSDVWLNKNNDWIYRHLHKAAERMIELANDYTNADGMLRDALNQASRELLLAQSSDWAFIMEAKTMVEYARKRTQDHVGRFTKLYYDIKENNVDEEWLKEIMWKDNIFSDIDYRIFRSYGRCS